MAARWSSQVSRIATSILVAGGVGLATAGPVGADTGPEIQGKTYGEWSAAWWQWAEEFYTDSDGNMDFGTGRVDCSLGQSGPVWFLGGTSFGKAERRCTLKRNKYLFVPLVNAADFDDEPSCAQQPCTVEEQRDILNGIFSLEPPGIFGPPGTVACQLQADVCSGRCPDRVKGTPAVFSTPIVRTQSPPFEYDGNPDNVADGFWVMLDPLPPGRHRIHFAGGVCEIGTPIGQNIEDVFFWVDVTYRVRVR